MEFDFNLTNESHFVDSYDSAAAASSSYGNATNREGFRYAQSNSLLEQSTKYNLIVTFVVLILGLMGNTLILIVFGKKKNRINSSHVFLFCLALNDNLFLKVHLFENVLRTYQSFYSNSGHSSAVMRSFNKFIQFINIIEQYEVACRSANYLRYVLRLISALIIVAFTLQRLIIVIYPLKTKFKSKSFAWKTVATIVFISLIINAWIPFLFEIHTELEKNYCGIGKLWQSEYLTITLNYMIFTMLLPILIIFTANMCIIRRTFKSDSDRTTTLQVHKKEKRSSSAESKRNSVITNVIRRMSENNIVLFKCKIDEEKPKATSNSSAKRPSNLKPFYRTSQQMETKALNNLNNSKKITRMLMFISFSYAAFNLPYLVIWLVYYFKITFDFIDPTLRNQLFALTRSAETLQILNYALHFYVYCLSGSMFRKQLQTSIVSSFTTSSKKAKYVRVEYYAETNSRVVFN